MIGFTDPPFIIFSGIVWASTAVFSYMVSILLIRIRAPFTSDSQIRQFLEITFQVSILPYLVVWLYFAPQVAGYGVVLITFEGVIGLAVSAVIAFFTIALMIKEDNFEIPNEQPGETKGYYDC